MTCEATEYSARFNKAMDDDFNTPEAISVLFDLANHVNREREASPASAARLAAELKQLANVLGLLEADVETYLQAGAGTDDDAEKIEALIAAAFKSTHRQKLGRSRSHS